MSFKAEGRELGRIIGLRRSGQQVVGLNGHWGTGQQTTAMHRPPAVGASAAG